MKIKYILCYFLFLCGFKEVDTVIKVVDGNTIETKNNGKVRILGIDSYNSNPKNMKLQKERTGYNSQKIRDLSRQSKDFAIKELKGKQIILEKDAKSRDRDKQNRKLRYVKINGKDYGEKIIKKDLANVYCDDNNISLFNYYNKNSKFKCE